ncbi:MAG: hypothetical protein QM758_11170 [Armatimonas sp.]
MRIVISGRAAVYPESDLLPGDPKAVPITKPKILRELDGYDGELEDELAEDIDISLTGAGVQGGTLVFVYDKKSKELRVVSEYQCPRLLTDDELELLVQETVGAWSDGAGAGGFEAEWEDGEGHIYPNPPGYPIGTIDRDVRVEQLEV